MLIESDFFAGEHLRWNLGWASPNYAGAFIAVLLGLCFIFSQTRWRWGFFVLELGGFFLLAKTYSRGALVAWAAASLFGISSTSGLGSKMRWLWLGRMLGLGIILYSVGFQWSRAGNPSAASTAQTDRSVGNRLKLWEGGLKLIAAAPLRGWGAGESGRAYQHWVQDVERDERFTTMVNSYLTVAVEQGLLLFALALFVLYAPVLWAWRLARAGSFWAMAAGAGLIAWLSANGFSTLWIEWRLWIVPGIAYGILLWLGWRARKTRLGVMLPTGVVVLATTAALYASGVFLSKDDALAISPSPAGVVISPKNGASAKEWHVWADPAVLGEFYGKELRRGFLDSAETQRRFIVHSVFGGKAAELPSSADGVLLFGKQAARLGREGELPFPENCETLNIIHPTTSPPPLNGQAGLPQHITVIFPEIDEMGNRRAWESWAVARGARFVVSKGSGLDIRAVWPEVLRAAEGGKVQE